MFLCNPFRVLIFNIFSAGLYPRLFMLRTLRGGSLIPIDAALNFGNEGKKKARRRGFPAALEC
jgi:hypothetical protein